jgi:hypothetical protein
MIHYGVSKTAQLSLARGLAKFVAGSGVTVNSVLPGPTLSDGFAEMMKDEIEKTGKSLETLAKEFVMAIWLRHQTTHTCQLTNLCRGTTRTGVGHHVNAVEGNLLLFYAVTVNNGFGLQVIHHRFGNAIVRRGIAVRRMTRLPGRFTPAMLTPALSPAG